MAHRVLIVEDEAILAKNIQQFLVYHDYHALVAGTGEEGLKQVEEFRPDVILLDIHLPDGDGRQVLPLIRRIDENIGVIIITAFGSVELAIDAMAGGASNYVEKPVALGTLKLLIDRFIEQR